MPVYEVQHACPLNPSQKQDIASSITSLHATTFNTPFFFVNVRFVLSEPYGDFFIAGKPTFSNRVIATVRASNTRRKEDYDQLGKKIHEAWDRIVGVKAEPHEITEDDRLKRLHRVGFIPAVTTREFGLALPSAGNEAAWLSDHMPYFTEHAEVWKDESFVDLLEDMQRRPELLSTNTFK